MRLVLFSCPKVNEKFLGENPILRYNKNRKVYEVKRAISVCILLLLLFFIAQFAIVYFKKDHEANYQISKEDITFEVKEQYNKGNNDTYYISISTGNYQFGYTVENKFNKRKQIIEDIELIQRDGMMCIFPIFGEEHNDQNIECSSENVLYSYETQKTNPLVLEFVQYLQERKYQNASWQETTAEGGKTTTSTIYKNNLLDGDYITVWNYQSLEIITKNGTSEQNLSSHEKYENTHGTLVGKYYVLPVYYSDTVFDFQELLIYDVVEKKAERLDLERTMSQDTYINGIVDGKLYYMDKDNLVQLEINPEKKQYRVIGNTELNGQMYNGNWETVNIYDLVTEHKFQKDYSNIPEIASKNPVMTYENETDYYYYTADGNFYRLSKRNLNLPMLLFQQTAFKEVLFNQDTFYFVIDNSLYYYNENYGKKLILQNEELKYNDNNRIAIYKAPTEK